MTIKSGTLGGLTLTAGEEAKPYSCSAPAVAAGITVSFCNKTSGPVRVRLAHGAGANSSENGTLFLEYDATIAPSGVLERSGIAISAGRSIFVKSDTTGVDVSVYGFEK